MKYIYEAFDGTQFDDEDECYIYEWNHNHPYLKEVKFLDENNEEFSDIFSEDTYNNTETIIVPSSDCIPELKDLIKYTGFMSYEDIDSPGIWTFCKSVNTFVKSA